MNTKNPLPSFVSIILTGFAATTSANWILVEDFESGTDNIYSLRWVEPEPIFGVFEDPVDPDNQIFYYDSNAYGIAWAANFAAITLPAAIPAGGQGSLYLRFFSTATGHNVSVGLSHVPVTPDPEAPHENAMSAPAGWAAFESQNRMYAMNADKFGVRHGPAFIDSDLSPPVNEWFEIWFLVDNAAQTTEFYVKAASDPEPVRVTFTDDLGNVLTTADFRNGAGEDLVTFLYGTATGPTENPYPGDAFFIDDIHIDVTGHNLSSPLDGTQDVWAGFLIGPGNWADTGDWMGMVYPLGDYVYVLDLGGWLYLPEAHVTGDGAWAFGIR